VGRSDRGGRGGRLRSFWGSILLVVEEQSAADKAVDKATEKVCIERWHWTLVKIVAALTIISAIAHVGEAVGEIIKLWP
jgi:uncharacterized membrane protein